MKFSTVEIRPSGCNRDEWDVSFSDLPGDRYNDGQGPNGLGFYHYPRRLGKKKAFDALKAHLVAKHEERISSLEKSLAKLRAIKMPSES